MTLDIYRIDEVMYNPWTYRYETLARWYCGASKYTLALAEKSADGRYVIQFRLPGCEVNDQSLSCNIDEVDGSVRRVLTDWLALSLPALDELGFFFAKDMLKGRSIN